MKKFFIAFCGILIIGNAISQDKLEPNKIDNSDLCTLWGATSKDEHIYSQNVGNDNGTYIFAPKYQFNTRAGTYGTNWEGSIVAIIAREIWEHGGYFCTTQIQAAYHGWGWRDWIDYYTNDSYKCEIICEPEYTGEKCSVHKYDCLHTNKDYKNDLDDVKNDELRITSGRTDGRITTKIPVFYYENDYEDEKSYAVVLGVIKRMKHGVIVAPVRVNAKDRGKIESAYSTVKTTLLCAPGYTSNSTGDDCVLASICNPSSGNPELSDWCDGWDNFAFSENSHKIVIGDGCKEYRCRNENFGFETFANKRCVSCGTGKKYERFGVTSNGVCTDCFATNKIFSSDKQECVARKSYNQKQMRENDKKDQCWMQTDKDNYKDCIK